MSKEAEECLKNNVHPLAIEQNLLSIKEITGLMEVYHKEQLKKIINEPHPSPLDRASQDFINGVEWLKQKLLKTIKNNGNRNKYRCNR